MAEEATGPQSLNEFPDEVREDVNGLIYLGALSESFSEYGHHFTIRTLNGEEELAVGLLTKEYQDTVTQVKAFVWANVALALTEIDGDTEFCPPVAPDPMENYRARYRFALSNWYWPLTQTIYRHFEQLQIRQSTAMAAMRDLSLRSQANSSPLPDSSTDQASSEIEQYLEDDSTTLTGSSSSI